MLRPVLVTPASALVSTADAKAHLRVEDATDDALIDALVKAATDYLDGQAGLLGRCIGSQVWRQDYPDWASRLRLPFPDVTSVVVKYFDTANVEQTLADTNYDLLEDSKSSYIRFVDSFAEPSVYDDRDDVVQVTLTAGYATVPEAIIAVVKLLVGHWYENREAVVTGTISTNLQLTIEALTDLYKRNRL